MATKKIGGLNLNRSRGLKSPARKSDKSPRSNNGSQAEITNDIKNFAPSNEREVSG